MTNQETQSDREQFTPCPNCKTGRMAIQGDGCLWCDRCELPQANDVQAAHEANMSDARDLRITLDGPIPTKPALHLYCLPGHPPRFTQVKEVYDDGTIGIVDVGSYHEPLRMCPRAYVWSWPVLFCVKGKTFMSDVQFLFNAKLSAVDHLHVQQAIEHRRSFSVMPDATESDETGSLLAEICRGWLESHGQDLASESIGQTELASTTE